MRLARKLCGHCREPYHPSKEQFDDIINDYGRKQFTSTGINYDDGLTLFRSVGCDKCFNTGYIGRIGIHELLVITPEIKSMVNERAPAEWILEQAISDGMSTLVQDGILKVFQGKTDMAEVRRVCMN